MYSSVNEFLSRAARIVEKNIQIDRYNLDRFANDLAMSKSSLNKKIKTTSGFTPNEFIENVKFKFALRLLKQTDLSVKEIAYSSGFNDPKYFTRRFKKEFGLSPKEYKSNLKLSPTYIWETFNLN